MVVVVVVVAEVVVFVTVVVLVVVVLALVVVTVVVVAVVFVTEVPVEVVDVAVVATHASQSTGQDFCKIGPVTLRVHWLALVPAHSAGSGIPLHKAVVEVVLVSVAVVTELVVVAVVEVVQAPHIAGHALSTAFAISGALQSENTKSAQSNGSSGIPLQLTMVVGVADVLVVAVVVHLSHIAGQSSITVSPNTGSVQSDTSNSE